MYMTWRVSEFEAKKIDLSHRVYGRASALELECQSHFRYISFCRMELNQNLEKALGRINVGESGEE